MFLKLTFEKKRNFKSKKIIIFPKKICKNFSKIPKRKIAKLCNFQRAQNANFSLLAFLPQFFQI